ncbi:MAG TPA: DEAD/DEAH box helicase [Xanthobacteraceae bacterium]|nr:DEAD/DEAH box helicase [Xanthobacteraceae bacterium]
MERLDLNSFNELGLAAPIARALADEKYEIPTPIQAQAIPPILERHDLVGIAQTGTGKTAAFALPIINHLLTHRLRAEQRACRVLILSPTRELSGQILESFRTYGRHVRLTTALAIGGVPIGRQVRSLINGVDVLVATPGRLLDLMQSNAVRLDRIEVFVLDEADRMLDMGFIRDIRKIVAKLPAKRQTLFFSATMPGEIEQLAGEMLRDPVRVAVTPQAKTADRVDQRIVHVDRADKAGLLAELLKSETVDRALVFTRTKHGADKVVRSLEKAGIRAEAIHGNKSQNNRERALANFRSGRVRTLIATDIAARGIDVDGVSHVFNYDLPNIAESYVHRIGRTARAGAEGIAISFCDREEMPYLRDIEKLIKLQIPSTDRRRNKSAAPQAAGDGHPHRSHRQPRNGRGHGKRHGRPEGRQDNHGHGRPHQQAQAQHREPSHANNGKIESVAFMQRKRKPNRHPANGAERPVH